MVTSIFPIRKKLEYIFHGKIFIIEYFINYIENKSIENNQIYV